MMLEVAPGPRSFALQQRQPGGRRMYGTPSPPPLSAEESEAMRAKQEVLIQTNSELRVQLLDSVRKVVENGALSDQFMREAFPIMQKALDDDSIASLQECVNSCNYAMFYNIATQWMEGIMAQQVELVAAHEKDKTFMTQLKGDLEEATAEKAELLQRMEKLRQTAEELEGECDEMQKEHDDHMQAVRRKAESLIAQERETGRLAYEKVMAEYEKLKAHAQALESDIDKMEARMAAGEKERENALAAAAAATAAMTAALASGSGGSTGAASGEVEQLKKDLEQAETVFAKLKEQNDFLEAERGKLAVRLKWKEEAARRWDGEDSDNEEDVDQRFDPAGALLKAQLKKTRNKERSKRMTFAQYIESLQRENARNKADHLRSAQEAAALRASVRTLRSNNAELEMEAAELRGQFSTWKRGILLDVSKMQRAREHGELTATEVEEELLAKIDQLQTELHSVNWRFVCEKKAHAEALKQAEATTRQQVTGESQKIATVERRLEEAKRAAAERDKALLQEIESLKLANTRRTEAKNKELEEARAEISALKKSDRQSSSSLPVAVPIEARCGGIALQILSVVAGKYASEFPIIREFHACVSAINKASLAPDATQQVQHAQQRVSQLYQQLYQCVSRTCVGNASLLQLYQAFDQASSASAAAVAVEHESVAAAGKRARPVAADGEAVAVAGVSPVAVELQQWQEFALALQPLLYIFVGFADYVSRGNTWRHDRPDMRPMFEHLCKVAEVVKSLPPSFATTKALKEALGTPVMPAKEGGGAAFVNVVEAFARGCIAVNTTFAAETVRQLEEEKTRTVKMHEYAKIVCRQFSLICFTGTTSLSSRTWKRRWPTS